MKIPQRTLYTVIGYYRFPILSRMGVAKNFTEVILHIFSFAESISIRSICVFDPEQKIIFAITRKKEKWIKDNNILFR